MQEKRWQWSISLLLSLASRLRGRHGCFGFVCWSVGRLVGQSVDWSVGRWLARCSLACWKEVSLLQLKRCFYIGTNTVYSGRHPAAIFGMNWNKSLVREITRSSARNLPKKVFVTSRISAGFLPVEVEHCPKTAWFLQNSGSCDLCRTRGKGLLVKKGNLSILQKIVWELFLAYGIAWIQIATSWYKYKQIKSMSIKLF